MKKIVVVLLLLFLAVPALAEDTFLLKITVVGYGKVETDPADYTFESTYAEYPIPEPRQTSFGVLASTSGSPVVANPPEVEQVAVTYPGAPAVYNTRATCPYITAYSFKVPVNQKISFAAVPLGGSTFVFWQGITIEEPGVIMDADKEVTAVFDYLIPTVSAEVPRYAAEGVSGGCFIGAAE